MKISIVNVCCCLAVALLSMGCSSGDAASSQARAVTCHACHGGNGMQTVPNAPRLAGQNRYYIAKQLRDFRDGKRNDPVMEPLATSLSDRQIDDIAAYFATLDYCADSN